MPNLSPGIFSAHDHAEGEFFSAANENAGRVSEAAQTGQNGQEIAAAAAVSKLAARAKTPAALAKIDDGDQRHQRERDSACRARTGAKLQTPAA